MQDRWPKIKKARQRLVLYRLMIDIMRTVHGAYAPVSEPFGTRLRNFLRRLMRGAWRHRRQAIFCRQDRCLYAHAPYYSHTAGSISCNDGV